MEGTPRALPPRSEIDRLILPNAFLWATGIEDTFVDHPHAKSGRTLDEYALTGHYERLESDLDRIAALGVECARYGLPWYRIEPARGRWDWGFADQALEGLLARGVEPIVDLVHYGTPAWFRGGFLDSDYPSTVAEYAAAVASRYRGRVRWYTPLNEPRITAYYCLLWQIGPLATLRARLARLRAGDAERLPEDRDDGGDAPGRRP